MNWKYGRKNIKEVPEGAEGFVYIIHYENGDYYIGKKSFWSTRRVKVKGQTRRRVIRKESDWRTYRGSSEDAKKRKDIAKLEILHLCGCKGCTLFYEIYEQVVRNVLCDPKALNKNIFLKIFRCYKRL